MNRKFTMLAALVLSQSVWVHAAPKKVQSQQSGLQLAVSDLVALKQRAEKYNTTLPDPAPLGMSKIIAYEEHKHFVCIVGEAQTPKMLRRMILLKPSTLVVDDRIVGLAEGVPLHWRLLSGQSKVNVSYTIVRPGEVPMNPTKKGGDVIFDAIPEVKDGATRFVSIINLDGKQAPAVKSDSRSAPLVLDIANGGAPCKLVLPACAGSAGTIAIAGADGKKVLSERLLPSGIMPHGPRGVRMLSGWDGVYQRKNPAPWDTGKVAVELKKVVEDGTIKPGRAIVLGCGTGTNSIYLASKGFKVTAIDIAPTALAMAKAKADKAKVSVRWMLVDVTAVPKLKPFDFIFDRGCYHGVRRSNAKGFVESARKLSHEGTKFLILAGNANEKRHYGPPRVKETDIRKDFTSLFDFTWLREKQFTLVGTDRKGPLMWSILLTRKGK